MPAFPAFVSCRALRCAVVWLLAALLPVQGMAAALLATLGPLHTHRAIVGGAKPLQNGIAGSAPTFDAALVLVDFRRGATAPAATHVALPFGHVHVAAAPQRHRHARADASVVVAGADLVAAAASGGDADDGGVSPSLACWAALPSRAPGVVEPVPVHDRAPERAAAWHSRAPPPPEPPPRSA